MKYFYKSYHFNIGIFFYQSWRTHFPNPELALIFLLMQASLSKKMH